MNSYGIYFGPKFITIVESKGRRLLNCLDLPITKAFQSGLEDKVPEEIKIVAFINNELRKNRLEIKEAAVIIPGNDLIIRTFDLPSSLSQRELVGAINYEARKYIPFKIEDLVIGFQWQLDSKAKKFQILLLGIKNDIFDRYLYIFKQLNIKISLIEYSAFSILRFLKATGCKFRGITAVVDIDLSESDEGNFIVMDNGYPLFSRDIILSTGANIESPAEEKIKISAAAIDKLKAELRMSLDFYQRKFPAKIIQKVYFLSPQDCLAQVEPFMNEKGLPVEFINFTRYTSEVAVSSLGFFKSFGGSLHNAIKHESIKIDFLSSRERVLTDKEKKGSLTDFSLPEFLSSFKIDFRVVFLGVLICAFSYGFGLYQAIPIQKAIRDLIDRLPKSAISDPNSSYDSLFKTSTEYQTKIKELNALIKRSVYITEQIDALPRLVPSGMWLTNFNFQQEGMNNREIILRGSVYLEDNEKELQLVNKFLGLLKQSPKFERYTKNMYIISVGRSISDKISMTNFEISCRDYK
ncbi:MAG: pilus assembly protein PilM [Candidatus Omnitrophota bacterium]